MKLTLITMASAATIAVSIAYVLHGEVVTPTVVPVVSGSAFRPHSTGIGVVDNDLLDISYVVPQFNAVLRRQFRAHSDMKTNPTDKVYAAQWSAGGQLNTLFLCKPGFGPTYTGDQWRLRHWVDGSLVGEYRHASGQLVTGQWGPLTLQTGAVEELIDPFPGL